MEYSATHHRQFNRGRNPQVGFHLRAFVALLGFLAFALVYVSVGMRWHFYRAQAGIYAQQEMDSTFKAAEYLRAARNPGLTDDAPRRAKEYRRLADMHAKLAAESTRLREFYERAW